MHVPSWNFGLGALVIMIGAQVLVDLVGAIHALIRFSYNATRVLIFSVIGTLEWLMRPAWGENS